LKYNYLQKKSVNRDTNVVWANEAVVDEAKKVENVIVNES